MFTEYTSKFMQKTIKKHQKCDKSQKHIIFKLIFTVKGKHRASKLHDESIVLMLRAYMGSVHSSLSEDSVAPLFFKSIKKQNRNLSSYSLEKLPGMYR